TAPPPIATYVAPISPPYNACVELEGRPTTQVSRFQMIAPTRPANTTVGVILVSSTMPLEIVSAILMDRNAPTRFPTAAMLTATPGLNARVATDVATASEAS